MSELGQKRKSGDANATSDLPLKADIKRTWRHVRFVPIPDSCTVANCIFYSITTSALPSNVAGSSIPKRCGRILAQGQSILVCQRAHPGHRKPRNQSRAADALETTDGRRREILKPLKRKPWWRPSQRIAKSQRPSKTRRRTIQCSHAEAGGRAGT